MDTPNINFLDRLISGASFFLISTFLREKYFDVVWGYHPPPQGPPKIDPQKQFFE